MDLCHIYAAEKFPRGSLQDLRTEEVEWIIEDMGYCKWEPDNQTKTIFENWSERKCLMYEKDPFMNDWTLQKLALGRCVKSFADQTIIANAMKRVRVGIARGLSWLLWSKLFIDADGKIWLMSFCREEQFMTVADEERALRKQWQKLCRPFVSIGFTGRFDDSGPPNQRRLAIDKIRDWCLRHKDIGLRVSFTHDRWTLRHPDFRLAIIPRLGIRANNDLGREERVDSDKTGLSAIHRIFPDHKVQAGPLFMFDREGNLIQEPEPIKATTIMENSNAKKNRAV
ncbi:TPA: hypothetical protein DF272_06695 [Candidatus Falkowbacteria bacterium]|nr:hypothetical protein [Candidatus Falkowbacteria bacterium]